MAITAMKDGRFVEINKSFMKAIGFKYEELVGNSSTGARYITEDSRALFLEEYRQKGFVKNLEMTTQVAGGQFRRCLFNSSKITIDSEDFFLTAVTDITGLRQLEQAMRESETLYRNIINATSDMVFLKDEQFRHVMTNQSYNAFYGKPEEEVIGKTDFELMPQMVTEKDRQTDQEVLKSKFTLRYEKTFGDQCYEIVKFPMEMANGTGIGGFIRNITAHKQAESELRKYIEELEIFVRAQTSEFELRKYIEELEILVRARIDELESKTKELQDIEATLTVLLQRRDEDKKILEKREEDKRKKMEKLVITNIENFVIPYVKKMKSHKLDARHKVCLDIIEMRLNEILSPLSKNVKQFNLTPRENQLLALIKDDKTSTEISEILGVAKCTIDSHRKNIRKKLGLSKTANLKAHLDSLK